MSNTVTTVTSQANPLAYAKAIVALIGSIATGLLTVYGPATTVGQVLTVITVVATAVGTWVVPNALVVPATISTEHPDLVDVDSEEDDYDDGLTYEESGGLPVPSDADEPTLYSDGDDPHRNY